MSRRWWIPDAGLLQVALRPLLPSGRLLLHHDFDALSIGLPAQASRTRRLLEEARQNEVGHVLYLSMMGADRLPWPEMASALLGEEMIRNGQVPWSILRLPPLFEQADRYLNEASTWPALFAPRGWLIQPAAAADLAQAIAAQAAVGPSRRTHSLGGPEILTLEALARTWLSVTRRPRELWALPRFGRESAEIRRGVCIDSSGRLSGLSWSDWVEITRGRKWVARDRAASRGRVVPIR